MAKKGISPLIAVVLLVVFTVGVSVIISSWLSQYAKQTTRRAGSGTERAVECAKALVQITGASDSGVFVANIGASDVNVTMIKVYYANGSLACYGTPTDGQLKIGEEKYFGYNIIGCTTPVSNIGKVEVSTNCGFGDSYEY